MQFDAVTIVAICSKYHIGFQNTRDVHILRGHFRCHVVCHVNVRISRDLLFYVRNRDAALGIWQQMYGSSIILHSNGE